MQIKAITFFIALYFILIVIAVPTPSGNNKRVEEISGTSNGGISSVNLSRRRAYSYRKSAGQSRGRTYPASRRRGGGPLGTVTKTVETLVESIPIPNS